MDELRILCWLTLERPEGNRDGCCLGIKSFIQVELLTVVKDSVGIPPLEYVQIGSGDR
jgi:hypothetical protein